jgi:hypothetical protein
MFDPHVVKAVLVGASIVAAIIAAGLWWRASTIYVPYKPVVVDGWTSGGIIVTKRIKGRDIDIDPIASADAQSAWNKWAALAAVSSAVLQSINFGIYGP